MINYFDVMCEIGAVYGDWNRNIQKSDKKAFLSIKRIIDAYLKEEEDDD